MVRRISRLAIYAAAFFLFWSIAAPSAHAYIDPGSSSFIIQILIGAAAGAGLAIATFWRRIRLFFGRLFGRTPSDDETSQTPPAEDRPPVAPPPSETN